MKQKIVVIALIIAGFVGLSNCSNPTPAPSAKSIGIVIYSSDIETVWNALRFANHAKTKGDTVNIFLLGKGVELENLVNADKNVKEQADSFINSGGIILGCGTCLKSRNTNEPQVCKFSSMNDLYEMVHACSIVMTF